jgi:uncharacterized phosphatase
VQDDTMRMPDAPAPAPSGVVTTLCLVRHGETDWNRARRYQGWSDIPLNATGLAQAELVAEVLGDEHWDAIVSSPLSRAMQTADAISRTTGISKIIEDADLRERGYGEAEGLTLEEREAKWAGQEWPGLEALEVMGARAMDALDRIVAALPGKRVIVVCHGGLINAVLARISNGEIGTGITLIQNTARTTIIRDNRGWTVTEVAVADHLDMAAVAD